MRSWGKKCANLGEMTKIGLRVPPGLTLSLQAYEDFMSLTKATREIQEYLRKFGNTLEGIKQLNEASGESAIGGYFARNYVT